METEVKGIKTWLSKILDKILGESRTCYECNPSALPSYELEKFSHEGYDIEMRVYKDRNVHISAFLKGQCCLDGWLTPNGDWTWNSFPNAPHLPGYRIRTYLKQYAQERINKE